MFSNSAVSTNPAREGDGELVPQEVRLMGFQDLAGQINYSVLIDVTAVLVPRGSSTGCCGY
jgi:hypothetical protein